MAEPVTVLDWNLGYGGLGEESDFVMDGGQNLLPPGKKIVAKNIKGIQGLLRIHPADIYFFQEISRPDMLNLGFDVFEAVKTTLTGYSSRFTFDFHTLFIPRKWALKHGLATFAKSPPKKFDIRRLPYEPTRLGKLLQRQYHIQASHYMIEGKPWVFVNIHLSAFDEGGNVRIRQLEALMLIARDYYEAGNHVVIGGDWNMQLQETHFPNTTNMKDLFWLKKLPKEKLPDGWTLAVDISTPSVRTNYQPYKKGENYTTNIDGFLVSPNVEVLEVITIDTGFKYTDHQPVLGRFRSRTPEQAHQ